jgi:type II secretory pathway pseudopilin PulG
MARATHRPARQQGFTYLGLLFAVALLGLVLSTAATVWTTAGKRQRERELLWVGDQFRLAIRRYYLNGPGGIRVYPRKLDDLLDDRRGPVVKHHLRRIYLDPLTGQDDWQLVTSPDGQILGVYSPSLDVPLKKAGFSADDEFFDEAETYSDWRFLYLPQLGGTTVPTRDYRDLFTRPK